MRLAPPHVIAACVWMVGAILHAGQQPECLHDPEACHTGECKVYEGNRFVCEPETYAVMVFPRKCIIKDELTANSKLEIRLDANGVPDKSTARVTGTVLDYKPDCGHVEIRKRNVN